MPRYGAFLRGMNLGGRRVKNDQLRLHFEAIGFWDVEVFRASGNVIFATEAEPVDETTSRVELGLAASLGYEVIAFLRTASEIRAIAGHEPFDPAQATNGKLQVALLREPPAAIVREDVLQLAPDDDRLAFGERELYWLPHAGTLDSALDMKAITNLLGVMTLRTMGTIELIARRYFAD